MRGYEMQIAVVHGRACETQQGDAQHHIFNLTLDTCGEKNNPIWWRVGGYLITWKKISGGFSQ